MAQPLKEQLLQMLIDHRDSYLSGQKISEALGCSRTAVWKQIAELKKEGYEVEGLQKRGYKLMTKPDNLRPHDIRVGLTTSFIGQTIIYRESLPSTQLLARKLANDHAEEGPIVVCEEQTAGKARLGRKWNSPKGEGIWLSLILRPNILPHKAPQLTLLTAVSVVDGIKNTTGIVCQIKWPNDILINGKKVVGILTELQAEADRVQSVISGFGINVNTKTFPPELASIATSLALENEGVDIERARLLQNILQRFEVLYNEYLAKGFRAIKPLWEEHATGLGKIITARTLSGNITGYAKGITNDGTLLIEDNEGKIHKIYSADIEIPFQS